MDANLNKKLVATNLPPEIQECIRTIYAKDKAFLKKFLPKTRRNNNQQWEVFVSSLRKK